MSPGDTDGGPAPYSTVQRRSSHNPSSQMNFGSENRELRKSGFLGLNRSEFPTNHNTDFLSKLANPTYTGNYLYITGLGTTHTKAEKSLKSQVK